MNSPPPLRPAGDRSRRGGGGRRAGSSPAPLDGPAPEWETSGRPLAVGRRSSQAAWNAAAAVLDPEIPCVTVEDLGILRSVEIEEGDVAVARLTPTYSGCPAVVAIELAVEAALREAGFSPRIERVMSPAWTTDWITEAGREKLRAYGIAPPEQASGSIRSLFGEVEVTCPKCGARETERVSEFGSTACKALYRCLACREPFDYFKCI